MKLTGVEKILLVGVFAVLAGPVPLLFLGVSPGPPALSVPRAPAEFVLTVSTDKDIYSPGEPVRITVWIVNVGDWSLRLELTSSCAVSFLVVDERNSVVFDESVHRACSLALSTVILPPDGSLQFDFSWDQTSNAGGPVPAARYYFVRGVLLSPTPVVGSSAQRSIFIVPGMGPPELAFASRSDRPVYAPGDSATITMILRNIGQSRTEMEFGRPCFMQFVILDEAFKEVYNSSKWWGCILPLTRVVLNPGESTSQSLPWDLTTDEGLPIPANHTYRVLASFLWPYEPFYGKYVSRTYLAGFMVRSPGT